MLESVFWGAGLIFVITRSQVHKMPVRSDKSSSKHALNLMKYILMQQLTDTYRYCQNHTTDLGSVLKALERETYLKTLSPQMISGPLQGQLFRMISLMLRPKNILEIGTFTGYATICLAAGLAEGGMIHTIEANEELEYLSRKYFEQAGLSEKIILSIGDAKTIVPALEETYDLVFIDAGKKDNALYYDLAFDKVRQHGFLLIDNVLWSGKVLEEQQDKMTNLIKAFNEKVQTDDRVENVLLPIRDGLMLVRKK